MTQRYRMKVPANAHPLVKQLIEHMNDSDQRKLAIVDRAGLHRNSLTNWSKGDSPRLGNFEAAVNAAGLRLVLVPIGQRAKDKASP